jgi:hypothetical protein
MIYTLKFESRIGLWELKINKFRARFYRDRYGAEKTVARYRRMLQSEADRYEKLRWNALFSMEKVAEFAYYDR